MRRAKQAGLGLGFGAIVALASCVPAPRPVPPPPPPPPHKSPPPKAALPPPDPGLGSFLIGGTLAQGGLVRGSAPPGTTALTLDGRPVAFAPDRHFLIGFGRDAPGQALLVADTAAGPVRRMLLVTARQWDIQSLPTLRKGTAPTPDFLARRPVELARINAARRIRSITDGWREPFIWPVTGPISGVFGSQRIYAGEPGEPHSGVDIARGAGTPVAAPADGVVVLAAAAPFTLEGNLLIIDHGMGLNSAFLHLSRIDVREGEHVRRGQIVGAIGQTGRATGPHLHWAMKLGDVRIDPALVAGTMGK